MSEHISFCVGKKTICLCDQEFLLGELSVQIINIWCCPIREMYRLLDEAKAFTAQYAATSDDTLLKCAHDCYQKLEDMLRQYPLLALLWDEGCIVQRAFLPKHPGCPFITTCLDRIGEVLNSILIFHTVIGHFIRTHIMPMEELTAGNLSTAVSTLKREHYRMSFPEKEELVYYPYPNWPVMLDFETQTEATGSNELQILEKYTTESLLMLLKIDFFKALEAGHLIRQCEYCGRFFLLTKRLHTKYCDNPAPDNPKYTCAQMGYRLTRRKENPEDDPKADALRRCLNRITKDCSRQIITAEDRDLLKAKAEELYHAAKIRSGITYEEFEESLKSKNLYPLCGVTRKSNPVGHPKKETVRS